MYSVIFESNVLAAYIYLQIYFLMNPHCKTQLEFAELLTNLLNLQNFLKDIFIKRRSNFQYSDWMIIRMG